ncbi:flagellar basal body L-ring protein FlgH [Benzoatithermus flavus]|uniref:Flagellar L-ring protein n=1 Tax=Benzoatithermus flavus TaxID=3108223 RepID=A0ABU8XUY5_9PROT
MRRSCAAPLLGLVLLAAAGCDRLDHLGKPPTLTPVGASEETSRLAAADVVRRLPTPSPPPALPTQPGSLWQMGSQNFFNDNRASRVGDILTVLINMNEQAQFKNQTSRDRNSSESMGASSFFGLEKRLAKVLPNGGSNGTPVDPSSLVDLSSGTSSKGTGSAQRSEQVQVKMAAIIAAILPNGNFVINGSQQVRVNYELRELQIAGVVRPQDITAENTVTYDKIAEARIAYGGRGQLTDVQQPRYGQQVLDMVLPF